MKSPARALLACLCLLLAACVQSPGPNDAGHAAANPAGDAHRLLAEALQAAPEQATTLRLQAAELLIQANKPRQALDTLATVAAPTLSGQPLAQFVRLSAKARVMQGDLASARALLLENPALDEALPLLDNAEQVALGEARAQILGLSGEPLASARERVYLATLLDDRSAARANHDAIWTALMNTPVGELDEAARNPTDNDFNGWLTLAIIAKQNQGDLDAQVAALADWQANHPEHPAAQTPPGGLDVLKRLSQERPRQLAILLPSSGRLAASGQAVRDGLMAGWYMARASGARVPELRFYDSAQGDFLTLYRQAVNDGAELVIGPLDKDKLRLLFDAGPLPVPTLALNQVDDYGTAPARLYQFALGPEQEIALLANRMQLVRHHGLLLAHAPEPWADRTSDIFRTQWLTLGGELRADARWDNNRKLPDSLKQALGINRSEGRWRELQQLWGAPLKFEPRRRQDIDAIMLVANPETGRLVMPLLQFLYAGDLPVYASSQIFTGNINPDIDHDLDGLRFCDMGWLMQPDSSLRRLLSPWVSADMAPFLRLYALGVDAFMVHPRLLQLEQFPSSVFFGYTGRLRLDPQRRMTREMDCAIFRNGQPRLLPAVTELPAWH